MRACIQRVSEALVTVEGGVIGQIGHGLVVLLGVGRQDSDVDARWLAEKTIGLRIFEDDDGKMNRSLAEVGGAILVVSQFSLYGDCRRGRRPSFTSAAPPPSKHRPGSLNTEKQRNGEGERGGERSGFGSHEP